MSALSLHSPFIGFKFRFSFKRFREQFVALLLSLLMPVALVPMTGCTPTEEQVFTTVISEIGPAALTILQIVALVGGPAASPTATAKINADAAALKQLYADFSAAASGAKGSIVAEINAAFTTLESDLQPIYTIAQVSDVNTQQKVSALILLIQNAVSLAEGLIPGLTVAATVAHGVKATLSPADLVSAWDKTLTAKTGNKTVDAYTAKHQLHYHNKFWRTVSFGVAK